VYGGREGNREEEIYEMMKKGKMGDDAETKESRIRGIGEGEYKIRKEGQKNIEKRGEGEHVSRQDGGSPGRQQAIC
jgi:hypothetical protein